jgi:hypothetical protein
LQVQQDQVERIEFGKKRKNAEAVELELSKRAKNVKNRNQGQRIKISRF